MCARGIYMHTRHIHTAWGCQHLITRSPINFLLKVYHTLNKETVKKIECLRNFHEHRRAHGTAALGFKIVNSCLCHLLQVVMVRCVSCLTFNFDTGGCRFELASIDIDIQCDQQDCAWIQFLNMHAQDEIIRQDEARRCPLHPVAALLYLQHVRCHAIRPVLCFESRRAPFRRKVWMFLRTSS